MKRLTLVFLSGFVGFGLFAQKLQLPKLFADHMVLQQQASVPIWGWAGRSETITLATSWGDTAIVTADAGTRWKAELQTPDGDYTRHSITISSADPGETILLRNILIGEVWLASGQSNMYWTSRQLKIPDLEQEVGQANLPDIRIFNVSLRASNTPQDDLEGEWQICSPDVMQNSSGTGYFFAKNLHEALDCPVGLIVDAWGGTPVEFWVPKEAFEHDPELVASAERLKVHRKWPTSEPGTGYNAMTYPLGSFTIAGIIWYQGEANVFDPLTYLEKMKILVGERRKQFGLDIPFYFVQIAPYRYTYENSAILRDQQRLAAQVIQNTGMVVCSDIGDTTNIHPSNKPVLGARLANLALKKHYQVLETEVESPDFESAHLEKGYTRVVFNHADGLHFAGEERGYFEVAEEDGVFQRVKAKIVDGTVRLDTRKIPQPMWVRFAFSNTATPVLFNGAGLPASCFAPQEIKIVSH